jgi:antitoxin ParD1/3/4
MMSRVPSKFMNNYKTYITIEDPQRVILSDLPFQSGQKIEIKIKVVDERRLALAKEMRDLQHFAMQ